MPQIKVYPPISLPDRGVSETQFKIWIEELEVYLSQEDKFRVFLEGEAYSEWESQENNPDRLNVLKGEDTGIPDAAGNNPAADREAKLKQRARDLRTVLSIIGRCVSQGHYDALVRHSTSMQSIYDMLRCDYDIQQKGIHFLNLIDMKYDTNKTTPIAFYNQYRTLVANNLVKANEVIKYKNNERMESNEKMSPMIEDLVLLNVVREIDSRLPAHIRTHYTHKMSKSERLMDFKNDIMNNVDKFLQELDKEENLASIHSVGVPRLAWIKQQGGKQPTSQGKGRQRQVQRMYCRLCHKCNMPREIYTGHNIGDKKCTQLSDQDRMKLNQVPKMGNISNMIDDTSDAESLAKEFGYEDCEEIDDDASQVQVNYCKMIGNP